MSNSLAWNAGSRKGIKELTKEFTDNLLAMSDRHVDEIHHEFEAQAPKIHTKTLEFDVRFEKLYLGLVAKYNDKKSIDIGFSAHDGTYNIDYAWHTIHIEKDAAKELSNYIVARLRKYEEEQQYKFVGGGTTSETVKICPYLTTRLWAELDIVAVIYKAEAESYSLAPEYIVSADEEADSMARKSVREFNIQHQPILCIGYLNEVDVDVAHKALLCTIEQYKATVSRFTWDATMQIANRLKDAKIRIAFFNSTPQGGGVALMRHALVRFARLLGVSLHWYVPKPKPEVFRITKTNHNILQGVADPTERLTDEQAEEIRSWTESNAKRFWLGEKGPLRSPKEGGAHMVVVDDPQMPYLVKMAKDADPDRPVIFRSHIQIRADLVDNEPESPTAKVFDWLWQYAKLADMFVAHPVKAFVPKKVPIERVAYLPATTDWLDGLNKELSVQDSVCYMNDYTYACIENGRYTIDFPKRDYIVQIARFDPAKGIDTVVRAYGELRRTYLRDTPLSQIPQLVIAGHGAVDDPDATIIFDATIKLIAQDYPEFASDISVMRIGPIDQILNVLMSNAKVALQLSTREGFEVKVSEALHAGIPCIATKAGGIPLQVEDGKSGFLVEPDDYKAVARHLHQLLTNAELWDEMSRYAGSHVSDEVGTVGNALSWFYLADTLAKGEKLKPHGRWVNDLAREKAGVPYGANEPKLPRHLTTSG